ncbi:MAG TPA: winged helix DNA-binding protein [Sphingomonas sp.]|nr:winged helix DNA-binding protein [Sphingomonas sp.]
MGETSDDNAPQLRQLSVEVDRIARALAELSAANSGEIPDRRGGAPDRRERPDRRAQGERRGHGDVHEPLAHSEMLTAIRATIRARRLRDQYFSGELFADPAWDMLLDLLLARLEGRAVAVSSLCIAAAVPPTTALRWIKRLTEEGVFVRTADPRDGRRIFIGLSDEAADGMSSYIRAIQQNGFSLP